MKRTTLLLDEANYVEIKKIAAAERITISELINDTLREVVLRKKQKKTHGRFIRLPTFNLGEPLVDLADRDRLYQQMEHE